MIHASGAIYQVRGDDGRILFVRRSDARDHAGEWAFPGGRIEEDETAIEASERETYEELGVRPASTALRPILTTIDDDVHFITHHANVIDAFRPELNEEHDRWVWARPDEAPKPLHPGAQKALERLSMNELDVAREIREGTLSSPQRFDNVLLVAMRITGTGAAYRPDLKEFVWRDQELYLNDDFLERCQGLSVIWLHPEKSVLNSKEFSDRVVGAIMLPYVKGNEVWGIAKIYDQKAAEMLETEQLSTSPAVVFRGPQTNSKVPLKDGKTLLIEGEPTLLDHLAICEQGVWDKAGPPTGVLNEHLDERADSMTEKPEAAEAAKADADGGTELGKVLAKLDSLGARVDALSEESKADRARFDAFEKERADAAAAKADAAKKDAEDCAPGEKKPDSKKADEFPPKDADGDEDGDSPKEEKKEKEEGETKEVAADKKRKDAEKPGEEVKMDSAAVANLFDELKRAQRKIEALEAVTKPRPEADQTVFADAQARADAAYQAFGMRAPAPLAAETIMRYRNRLARGLQKYSQAWKEIDIAKLIETPEAFSVAERTIYADAIVASSRPSDLVQGQLREIARTDPVTGQRVTEFVGNGTTTYIAAFKGPSRRVSKFIRKGN